MIEPSVFCSLSSHTAVVKRSSALDTFTVAPGRGGHMTHTQCLLHG